ncbi:MAG TPA: class I SAM-dependent methyltransferase [Kineosporiaceae bacterium]
MTMPLSTQTPPGPRASTGPGPGPVNEPPRCRLCAAPLTRTFVDLGMSPPCESYLSVDQLDQPETFYPLHVRVCESCLLVQLPAYVTPESVFSDYAYFSSYSSSWVEHARRFVEQTVHDLRLGPDSRIVEVASNDGYLLQHALPLGIPVLGIEPAANIAEVARARGVPTECRFLGEEVGHQLADRYGKADLVIGNNVLAHVPALLDFVRGLRALVKDGGLVSLEFPHLLRLIEQRQYDTIYHEHFSYLTLRTAARALATADLVVVDVVELPTHGGSLRVLARPAASAESRSARVAELLAEEEAAGLHTIDGYTGFAAAVLAVKSDLLGFLVDAARNGRSVAGYGAPGKGNTLLNHCGIRADLLPFTVDRNIHKQGKFLPGTHIPVHPPERLDLLRPDFVLVLPWNLRQEVIQQLAHAREWGGRFVVPIPHLEIL